MIVSMYKPTHRAHLPRRKNGNDFPSDARCLPSASGMRACALDCPRHMPETYAEYTATHRHHRLIF